MADATVSGLFEDCSFWGIWTSVLIFPLESLAKSKHFCARKCTFYRSSYKFQSVESVLLSLQWKIIDSCDFHPSCDFQIPMNCWRKRSGWRKRMFSWLFINQWLGATTDEWLALGQQGQREGGAGGAGRLDNVLHRGRPPPRPRHIWDFRWEDAISTFLLIAFAIFQILSETCGKF